MHTIISERRNKSATLFQSILSYLKLFPGTDTGILSYFNISLMPDDMGEREKRKNALNHF